MQTEVRHLPKSFVQNVTKMVTQASKLPKATNWMQTKVQYLPKSFAQFNPTVTQAPKVAESNEIDANEGKALAQIFRAKARPND